MTAERELIKRVQRGEKAAFREIVELHKRNVYYLALDLSGNHQDAEDISQEVFIKAFRYLKNFRGDSRLSSWLYRITVNCHIDSRRKKQVMLVSMSDDTAGELSIEEKTPGMHAADNPEEAAAAAEIKVHIQRALDKLSPRERSVFVLRHYKDLPLKEIAAILEIAEGTVKTLLFRALKRLQKELAFYQKDLGIDGIEN